MFDWELPFNFLTELITEFNQWLGQITVFCFKMYCFGTGSKVFCIYLI